MSRPGNVALVLPASFWGFYVLAVLFVIFRLQQSSYPRKVHGVLLMIGAVGQ